MNLKKWIPLFIIAALMIAAYFLGFFNFLTFETIKTYREKLLALNHKYPLIIPFFYMLSYVIAVTLSLPGAAILSLFEGFLFGIPLSTIYVIFSAAIGAVLLFLAAKSAMADVLRKKASPFFKKMEKGFQKNAASYLLFLRFIPIFPFWLVNLAPAFFQVPLWTYIWTTFIGIIPGAFVFTQAGSGLGAIFESGESFSLSTVFNMKVRISLALLGLFALIPVFAKPLIRKFGKEKNDR